MANKDQVFNIRPAEEAFAFSQAVKAGDFLFISGTVSWDHDANPIAPGDMAAQIKVVYDELKLTLEAHGASFANVVKETVYTVDLDQMAANSAIRAKYFADCAPPAATWIGITRLIHPDLMVEVEMTAYLG
ncbi:MAG: RidA family protein [Sphingopyxis sp.]|nr:RidA family protein [Sphingopyxis sp.]